MKIELILVNLRIEWIILYYIRIHIVRLKKKKSYLRIK